MEILIMLGKALLALLAIATVALSLFSNRHNHKLVWSVWRRFRIKMFFECACILTLTLLAFIALWEIPILRYGWISLFFGGEGGNMLIKPIQDGSESSNTLIRLIVPFFFIALAYIIPFLAQSEENSFRKGYSDWCSITKQSIKFGLVHCLVGIPVAAGIALIISGLFYGYKYKRSFDQNVKILGRKQAQKEAVMVSTTYHTMYNMIIVVPLIFVTISMI